jgi:hypothetical protein
MTEFTYYQKQEIANYVRWLADELELRDWEIDLYYEHQKSPRPDPDGSDWGLSIKQTRHRKHACLSIPPDSLDLFDDPEEFQQALCHELIHMHFGPMWDMVRVDLHDLDISQIQYDLFVSGFERLMEYGVDATAEAFAKRLPKWKWPPADPPPQAKRKRR